MAKKSGTTATKSAPKPKKAAPPADKVVANGDAVAEVKGVDKTAGITEEAVKKGTGRGWEDWCRILDDAGAEVMTHHEIAVFLTERDGLSAWWAQMVTVGYEQARGRREPNQAATGYQTSASRVIEVPVSRAYRAWADTRTRKRWLMTPFTVRVANRDKNLRVTWPDQTFVDVYFTPKGEGKCQVAVQQRKLKASSDVAKAKKFWADHLEQLRALLEE
ncbi:MAG: hypothetical protein KIS87_02960 [Phycisphaeraceae bacterium]|nr:hypothetical protein [Phycisphaeraceae bacterium]